MTTASTTASAQQLPQPGDTVAGKYRIERVLGTGGMGAVFEATHEVTGKRFAVKWLLPDLTGHADAVKRFIREALVVVLLDLKILVVFYFV
jgi:serine/threonine-protein kinase